MGLFHRSILYPLTVLLRGEISVYPTLRHLRRLEWRTPAYLRQRQSRKLAELLRYAGEHSPRYRHTVQADWLESGEDTTKIAHALSKIPLLRKSEIQRNPETLIAPKFKGRRGPKTTGGSTGEPVTILKDRSATGQEMAATWLSYGWFGVRIGDRSIRFWGSPKSLRRRLRYRAADWAVNRTTLSAFAFKEGDLREYWRKLVRCQPHYIHGYVSMLESFARFVSAEGLDTRRLQRLKVVVATSEVLTAPQRSLLTDVFQVPVLNEYGCGEVGPIAYECPDGSLHIMTDNIVLEILNDQDVPQPPGMPGHIVITDLNNRAMPLIRYSVGDFGVLADSPCPCGRGFPVLDRVWGRAYDFIETTDGRRYHGEFFMYLFEDLRDAGVPVGQFKIIQDTSNTLRILLRLTDGENSIATRRVEESLRNELPEMTIQITVVAHIPRAPSGKMRVIENRWREKDNLSTSQGPRVATP